MDTSSILHLPKITHAREHQGGVLAAYIDREYVFQHCVSGEAKFRLRDNLYRVTPGTTFLMPPQLPHALHFMTEVRDYRYLVVHFSLPEDSTLLKPFPMVVSLTGDDADAVSNCMRQIVSEWQTEQSGYRLITSGLLVNTLGIYWRHRGVDVPSDVVVSSAWQDIERAISWMHQHYTEPLTVDSMGQVAGLSPAYFCKAFKEYTGCSPHRYLNNIRVSKATQLLTTTELSCTQVAERVGIPTVAAFSRVFHRVMGVSPTQWVQDNYPNS